MDDETSELIQELVDMIQQMRLEIIALRHVLVDKKLTTEKELGLRMEDIKQEEIMHLKAEGLRRAWEKKLKDQREQ